LTYYGQKALTQRVKFLQDKPLAGPIGLIVVGHLAKKKWPTAGTALVGAGTYGLALAYDLNKMATSQAQPAAAGTNALIGGGDIEALISGGDIRGPLSVDQSAPQMASRMGPGSSLSIDEAMSL
jgi:hypothetical protein